MLDSYACVMLSSCFRLDKNKGVYLSADDQEHVRLHVSLLVVAAQNECTDTFQFLMNRDVIDQPYISIFKMMDFALNHGQILTVGMHVTMQWIQQCIFSLTKLKPVFHLP